MHLYCGLSSVCCDKRISQKECIFYIFLSHKTLPHRKNHNLFFRLKLRLLLPLLVQPLLLDISHQLFCPHGGNLREKSTVLHSEWTFIWQSFNNNTSYSIIAIVLYNVLFCFGILSKQYGKNPLIGNLVMEISLFCFLYKGAISRNNLKNFLN